MNSVQSKKKRWHFAVEKDFLLNQNLSSPARFLYILLQSFASPDSPRPFPGMEYLSKVMGCERKTVLKYRRELEEEGWLEVEARKTEDKRFTKNIYTLLDGPEPWVNSTHGKGYPKSNDSEAGKEISMGKKAATANLPTKSPHRDSISKSRPIPAVRSGGNKFEGLVAPEDSRPLNYSAPVIKFAQFSRRRGMHLLPPGRDGKARFKQGAKEGGWGRIKLDAWEKAYAWLAERHDPETVQDVLDWYLETYDTCRYTTKCCEFSTFAAAFDKIKTAKEINSQKTGPAKYNKDEGPEWTPAD